MCATADLSSNPTPEFQHHDQVVLDTTHATATEAACDLDRWYFDRHPDAHHYVRPMLEHELCRPGGQCTPAAGRLVLVIAYSPGSRGRMEVAA